MDELAQPLDIQPRIGELLLTKGLVVADDIEKGTDTFDRFKAGRNAYDKATPIAEIKKRYVSEADKSWLSESARSEKPG